MLAILAMGMKPVGFVVLIGISVGVANASFGQTSASRVDVERLLNAPMVGPGLDSGIGENIQDPTLVKVKVPEWVEDPLGSYYLHSLERTPQVTLAARSRQSTPQKRSWVKRHPVLFGAVVGAVAGAAIVGSTVDAEASFVGFYGGATGGAVVGWAVSR
jgi:hypothetical protein